MESCKILKTIKGRRKEGKETKNSMNRKKTDTNTVATNLTTSIISLNVSSLNTPTNDRDGQNG